MDITKQAILREIWVGWRVFAGGPSSMEWSSAAAGPNARCTEAQQEAKASSLGVNSTLQVSLPPFSHPFSTSLLFRFAIKANYDDVGVKIKHIRDQGGWKEGLVCRLLIISLFPQALCINPKLVYMYILTNTSTPGCWRKALHGAPVTCKY